MTRSAILTVAALLTIGAISPGPAVLMSARTGLTEGLRTGGFLALGIGAGAVFWAVVALSGLVMVVKLAPGVLWGIKIAGGLYLIWIALGLWRRADMPLAEPGAAPPRSPASAFRLGLGTQLSNPKPAVLMSSIFVGMVPPGTSGGVIGILLVYLFLAETTWNALVAKIFSSQGTCRAYIGAKTTIDRIFGGLLCLLGLKIAAF